LSDVISIRVTEELKEKMSRYDINWSEDFRKYLEARINSLELVKLLVGFSKKMKSLKEIQDSTGLIREDRDYR
jgi:hypothetical protein